MGPNDEKRLRQIKKIIGENVKLTHQKKEENVIIKNEYLDGDHHK